jgi:peptidoglycan/LPS O-acetylase OafA/YrhL
VPALDGLRVIAALSVVTYHAMGAVYPANPVAGVILPSAAFLFFVISGFVIYRPFAAAHLAGNRAPALGRFYRSRLIRVLPLWWLAVAAYLIVDGAGQLHGPGAWVATLLLVQYPWHSLRFAVIGPAWALSVEWIFYLVAPLIALAIAFVHRRYARRKDPMLVQAWVLGLLTVAAAVVPGARPALALLAGMGLAVFDIRRRQRRRDPVWLRTVAGSSRILVFVTLLSWFVLARYPYKSGLSVQWVESDAAVLAIWIATAVAWFVPVAFGPPDRWPQSVLGSPWAQRLSMLTFGVYLWHQIVLDQVVASLGRDGSFAAHLYLTLIISVTITIATYWLVERPGQRVNRRRPWSGASVPPAEGLPVTGEQRTEPAPAPSVPSGP